MLTELRMKLLQSHARSAMAQVNHALGTPWELNPTWVKELRVPVHTEVQVRFQGRNTSAATKRRFNRRSHSHKNRHDHRQKVNISSDHHHKHS